jgi:hypothetical protein
MYALIYLLIVAVVMFAWSVHTRLKALERKVVSVAAEPEEPLEPEEPREIYGAPNLVGMLGCLMGGQGLLGHLGTLLQEPQGAEPLATIDEDAAAETNAAEDADAEEADAEDADAEEEDEE